MQKKIAGKLISLLLIFSMMVGSATALSGCGKDSDKAVVLDVYCQLSSYSGLQTGWFADILKQKFNVKLNIVPDSSDTYETRMENENLGDIIVWANDSSGYPTAVKNGLLYNWKKDDLLSDYGKYIKKHMQPALKKNQELTSTITDGAKDTLYGFGHNVATSSEDHESFFYSWDVRWDLYKELGYPEINDLDDFKQLMKSMVKRCPKDDNGNPTYAVTLWSDWDESMLMYVKSMVTAYYGYDELGIGLYDPKTGKMHDALEEDGPYLEMLKFFNDLYQEGLLDPNSSEQTYDTAIEKVQSGGTMFSIFNYSGSLAYNTQAHTKAGKLMYCMKPQQAAPLVYGMNPQGGEQIWSIGASSEYPDLCMKVINYLCTPEGRMTMEYGPKGVCWDYENNGNTYFTELGRKCQEDPTTKMTGDYQGSFMEGACQITSTTWSIDASNPDSNGETYNWENWKSNLSKAESDIEQDWRNQTGCTGINDYMEKGKYVVSPGTSYKEGEKSGDLTTTWSQVTNEIRNGSWKAIYADSDKEYSKIVNDMIEKCNKSGYEECVSWTANEAARRKSLENLVTK